MRIETVSAGFKPALVQGNSNQAAFRIFTAVACSNPMDQDLAQILVGDTNLPDGTHKAGFRGALVQNHVKLMPWADQAGANFSVRVWTWREATQPGQSGSNLPVWVPAFLAEFACTSGTNPGVSTLGNPVVPSQYVLPDTAFLCDTIAMSQGDIGLTGRINSTGPGSNLNAYAMLEILGPRFVTFDFAQADQVGMNALWAFC